MKSQRKCVLSLSNPILDIPGPQLGRVRLGHVKRDTRMTRPEVEESVGSPTHIPGYELLELVGEGGTGRVYRARQLSLQRIVAIKVFPLSSGLGPPAAFERETRLLASLTHPNLVTVFDCGEVNGHHFIVTEFVEGSTLRPLIAPGKPWPLDRAIYVLDRLASALTYIHAKGVLHLDLKPENILCDAAGEPKIADFGLALPAADAPAVVERGETKGTPDYCARSSGSDCRRTSGAICSRWR